MMMFLSATAFSQGKLVQMGPSFIQPLQERDSVLIADQLFYGFELSQVEEGTQFAFPEIKDTLMTNMRIVKPWQMDTVKASRQKKGQPRFFDLKGGLTITTFEEGIYYLPPLAVQRRSVSMATSKIPQKPCSAGRVPSAVACAIGAVPHPASLESRPRNVP